MTPEREYDADLMQLAKETQADMDYEDRVPVFVEWLAENGGQYAAGLFAGLFGDADTVAATRRQIRADWMQFRAWDLSDDDVMAAYLDLETEDDDIIATQRADRPRGLRMGRMPR